MVRLTDNGAFDPSFCGDGMIVKDLGDIGATLDVRAFDDGSSLSVWVGGGITIVNRAPSCFIDPASGSGDVTSVDIPIDGRTIDAAWILPGGAVIVAGYTFAFGESSSFVARITGYGALDTSFGDGGVAVLATRFGSGFQTVITDARRRPIASGWADWVEGQKIQVARFQT